MYQTGLLLLTGPLRCLTESITHYLICACKNVVKCLYVKLEPEFSKPFHKSEVGNLVQLSAIIPSVYHTASIACKDLDVRILLSDAKQSKKNCLKSSDFDVVLTNSNENDSTIKSYIDVHLDKTCSKIIKLGNIKTTSREEEKIFLPTYQVYKTVCLGGTFDRLHNGHKVFLSEAVLRTTKKLIVGVTHGEIVTRKLLWELIEPTERRIEEVSKFLLDVDPSLCYEVVPMTDPYGPSVIYPEIECIVVTPDTKAGGDKVNVERKKRGMKELAVPVAGLLENVNKGPDEDEKISSSTNRMHLLGVPLKKSQKFSNPGEPYCVLLQGHPLSGKSHIADCLQTLGVLVVYCNDIIKSTLDEDCALREKVLMQFSNELTCPNGSIDYKKLMLLCLLDKEKREWIAAEVADKVTSAIEEKLQVHSRQGTRIIILEDSALLKLKINVQDVWATILPVSEELRRLCEYYGLNENEARCILTSLPSNKEYVQGSNIIFSNQWNNQKTQEQVERAWSHLKSILNMK